MPYILPVDGENLLYEAECALAALASILSDLGDRPVDSRSADIAALLTLIHERVAEARASLHTEQ